MQSQPERIGDRTSIRAPIDDLLRYLRTQREWIGNYAHWQGQGYPIGSGLVERAVSLIINRRMKKQGMRRNRENATALVTLRVQCFNEE